MTRNKDVLELFPIPVGLQKDGAATQPVSDALVLVQPQPPTAHPLSRSCMVEGVGKLAVCVA